MHILVDGYLKGRPVKERKRLAETLREKDRNDPTWLKRLIHEHLQQTRFWWRLYPSMGSERINRLKRLKPAERLRCLPAAFAGASLALVSGLLAFESLKAGCTNYWPQAKRQGLRRTVCES